MAVYEEIKFSTADALFQRQRLNYKAVFKEIEECLVLGPYCFTDMAISAATYMGIFDASVIFKEWVPTEVDAVLVWEKLSSELKALFDNSHGIPTDVTLFDADSVVHEEEQRAEAKRRIKKALKEELARDAVAFFKAARQRWPMEEEFWKADDDLTCLRELFMADFYPSELDKDKQVDILSPEFQEALKKLNDCFKQENMESLFKVQEKAKTLPENDILVGIGLHIIQKLAGSAVTSPTKCMKQCPCGCEDHLSSSNNMYIGTTETWHGELDLFASGVAMAVSQEVEAEAQDVEEDTDYPFAGTSDDTDSPKPQLQRSSSNDRVVNVESKIEQLMGQSIVFGFTEHNRHPEMTPYIPTILIDSKMFWALIYDPVADCLIAGNNSTLFNYSSLFPRYHTYHKSDMFQGLFLLWVLLHYRLFFRKVVDTPFEPLGFKKAARSAGTLNKYEALHEFQDRVVVDPKYEPLHSDIVMGLPLKKPRLMDS